MPAERPTKCSRVSRACDQCRAAREKCDGKQPTCLPCLGSKKPCTYKAPPKKRGIQPGYIRTLELTLTWLFQQHPESEAVLNKKLAREGNSSVLLSRNSRESNRLHKSWRRSKFCKDLNKLLSGEQIEPGDNISPASDDEESDPEVEVSSLQSPLPLLPLQDDILPNAFFTSPRLVQPARSPEVASPRNTEPATVTSLPTGSWRLLDIYFAYTQSWLPICEKHDVLRVSYSYPEEGMVLAKTLPDSGDHAELWSVLVVAAHQARLGRLETEVLPDVEWMYNIARGLIPTESGSFNVGHIKALLNLAVVNVGQGSTEVAWLLVGAACRLLTVIERDSRSLSPRWNHVVAGCFVLDNFLSLHLRGRPYLRRSEISAIEEDGLEEWQPWTNLFGPASAPPSRTPVLGLSSFNKLLDVMGTLTSSTSGRMANSGPSTGQLLSQLNFWKASLPAKFDYIIDQRKATPPHPPALLLQLTYICSLFTLTQSEAYIDSTINLLERFRDQLGVSALPPVILCLLGHMQMNSAYSTVERQLQERLQKVVAEIENAWSTTRRKDGVAAPIAAPTQARLSFGAYQVPTPESIQVPFSAYAPLSNRQPSSQHRASTSLLEELLPDMNPTTSLDHTSVNLHNFSLPALGNEFRRPSLHHSKSTAPHDVETYLDELASLDGAEKPNNQPQFMQNLGFAPDANISDLFAAESSQSIPAISTTLMLQNNEDPTQLDPSFFGAT